MTWNPYAPLISDDASGPVPADPEDASTWMRNFKCMAFLTAGYTILCAALAFFRIAIPELTATALFTVSVVASAWANVQLGPRIGWDRGGLSVVFVVFFMAIIVYCSTALIAGSMVYSALTAILDL